MLTCATCGNEEPEGSRFCGSCGVPFAQLAPATPSSRPAAEERLPVAPPPASPSSGNGRLRWVAAGAAVGLLVVGGAVAGVLMLGGGDDATEAIPTEQSVHTSTPEPLPPAPSQTFADSVGPRLEEVAASQSALSAQLRSLEAEVGSLAALRQAANALAARVMGAQQLVDGLAPTDTADRDTRLLLQRALAAHLVYAEAIAGLPSRPRFLNQTSAQAAMSRAEEARRAYVELTVADPALPIVYIRSSDNTSLIAVVPTPTPTRRVVDLVPLLVGIRPDDPLGEGRCFGPYSGASLRVSGAVYRSGFIQCGDDADGDPSRASGVYRFSGLSLPAGSRLVRITGQVVIDEFSSPSQRGSSVTWAVFYDGAHICSAAVTWSGSRPAPGKLDCRLPSAVASSGGFDLGRLWIQQNASLASSGTFWAGLFHPRIMVEVPR